jgi:hypothetical protein
MAETLHVGSKKNFCHLMVARGSLLLLGGESRFIIDGVLQGWCLLRREGDKLQVSGELSIAGKFSLCLDLDESKRALDLREVSAGEFFSSRTGWTSKDAPPVKFGLLSVTDESRDLAKRARISLDKWCASQGIKPKTLV